MSHDTFDLIGIFVCGGIVGFIIAFGCFAYQDLKDKSVERPDKATKGGK